VVGLGILLLEAAGLVLYYRWQATQPAAAPEPVRVVASRSLRRIDPRIPLGPVPAQPGPQNPRAALAPGATLAAGPSQALKPASPWTTAAEVRSIPGADGRARPVSVGKAGAGDPAAAPKPAKKPPATIQMAAAPTMPAQDWKVRHAYPDGLVLESTDGATLRKVKFAELPEAVQQQYHYDPQRADQFAAQQARAAAEYRAQQARAEAESRAQRARAEAESRAELSRKAGEFRATQEAAATADADQVREKLAILTQIVSDYHQSHTYSMEERFVCADMACDVWNMVKTKGIQAVIKVGCLDRDVTALHEANHAWVLAEITPGQWLALETTSGRVVYETENPRYYRGWSFENPRQFKELIYGKPGPGG
jgi:hypothetical protein